MQGRDSFPQEKVSVVDKGRRKEGCQPNPQTSASGASTDRMEGPGQAARDKCKFEARGMAVPSIRLADTGGGAHSRGQMSLTCPPSSGPEVWLRTLGFRDLEVVSLSLQERKARA